jgi:hypothetical protein
MADGRKRGHCDGERTRNGYSNLLCITMYTEDICTVWSFFNFLTLFKVNFKNNPPQSIFARTSPFGRAKLRGATDS